MNEPNLGPDVRRYAGFKAKWDRDLKAYVFDSQDERDRWQRREYAGVRNAFRREDESADGRPVLVYTHPPLDVAWLRAVRLAPREQHPDVPLSEYLAEIGRIVAGITGRGVAVEPQPPVDGWKP